MVFSFDELKQKIAPITQKYGLQAVYLFGSYVRGEATDASDVDILIDRSGSKIKGTLDMGSVYNDLCAGIGKEIDLVTTQTLEQKAPWSAPHSL